MNKTPPKTNSTEVSLLFVCMLFFKFSSDLGYLWLTTQDPLTYPAAFQPLKYTLGLLCVVALFFGIDHSRRKASSFLLYLMFLLQIVPITTIYGMGNESTEFYCVLCLSFFLCELLVRYVHNEEFFHRNESISAILFWCMIAVAIVTIALVVYKNGVPSLTALNIYDVYDLRQSGTFQLGKYLSYAFGWVTKVILPFILALSLTKKKYVVSAAACGIQLLMYLYSGNKTLLFAIPLVVICCLWARRESFYKELFVAACAAFTLLVVLAVFSPVLSDAFERIYSLLGRRTMLVPANNKFKYFDYFSNHPKIGIYGIFPRWMLPIDSYYENVAYSFDISAIYYGKPDMNSNTGFLAEGFLRFGHIGTVLIMVLFAFLLKQIDRFQNRFNYPLAVGLFVYPVFSLADIYLLDSLAFGPWTVLLLILIFSCPLRKQKTENARSLQGRTAFKSSKC